MREPLTLRDASTAQVVLTRSTLTTVIVDGGRLTSVTTRTAVENLTRPGPTITAVAFTAQDVGEGGIGSGTGGQGTVIGGAIRYVQAVAAATWTFTHPLGRPPQVTVYVLDGDVLEEVETDVAATDSQIVVTWPYPVAGELVVQ